MIHTQYLTDVLNDNYELRQDDNNDYYIKNCGTNTLFNIKNNWEPTDSNEKRYLRNATKLSIIENLRHRAEYSSTIKEFINWYDELNKPEDIIIPQQSNNIDLEPVLDILKEIKETNNKFETAIIEGIVEKANNISKEQLQQEISEYAKNFIDTTYGKLPTTIEIINNGETSKIEGLFHKDFETITKIVAQKIPLMLIGPAGSGKNYTLEQVSKALNLDFYFTNSITQEYKLTGFIDANGTYHETEFYKAFKNGGLFFFDEIDASCAESLIIINASLANGYFDFPNGRIDAHPDFRVVAAANTFGNGADMIYIGRNQLDGATLDRFATLEFDYDSSIEQSLCEDSDLYTFILELRKAIKKRRLRFVVSMRATINASKMLASGIDKETILKTVIIKSMTKDDINTITEEINIVNDWTKLLEKIKND